MDFHAAMETFAEAWVAANTQTAVNSDTQVTKQPTVEDLPTLLSKEQIASPKSDKSPVRPIVPQPQQQSNSPNAATKSLPIHCIVEQTNGPLTFDQNAECASSTSVELDSYAILPGSTLIGEIVRAALMKLGYSANDAMNAKGAIQIKNWKPLSFDSITDNAKATVEEILGELTQVATLRIRLSSSPGEIEPEHWTDHTVRCAVLSILKEMSQSSLAKMSPLSQSAISNIANWKYHNHLSVDKCREFGQWYKQYQSKISGFIESEGRPKDSRQTFHPEHELPLMRSWYQNCKNPSEEKLHFFVSELNRGHVRMERPKITVSKIKIWWKNERQREKRLKQKRDAEQFQQPTDHQMSGENHHCNASNSNNLTTYNITELGNKENRIITRTVLRSPAGSDSDIDVIAHSPPLTYENERPRIIAGSDNIVTLNTIGRREDESAAIYDRDGYASSTGNYEYRYVL